MKWKCQTNAQYSRRKCLEVVGILRDVSNEDLESTVLEVFSNNACEIPSRDIEACHHLMNNNDPIVVKFSRKKDRNQVMSVKRDDSSNTIILNTTINYITSTKRFIILNLNFKRNNKTFLEINLKSIFHLIQILYTF